MAKAATGKTNATKSNGKKGQLPNILVIWGDDIGM